MLPVELHFLGERTLLAEPNHFLFSIVGQTPSLRLVDGKGIDLAGAEPFKLGLAFGIGTFPQRRNTHIRYLRCT